MIVWLYETMPVHRAAQMDEEHTKCVVIVRGAGGGEGWRERERCRSFLNLSAHIERRLIVQQ